MRVKNLVLVNTRLITKVRSIDNFNTIVISKPGGYKILEKRYIHPDYSIAKQRKYFIPDTDEIIDKYYGQREGMYYRKGRAIPLRFFTRKRDLTKEEIKVLEKKINKKRK